MSEPCPKCDREYDSGDSEQDRAARISHTVTEHLSAAGRRQDNDRDAADGGA
jgi:hypothetical protein